MGVPVLSETEKQIRFKLIEIAKLKTTISYEQLNQELWLKLDFKGTPSDRELMGSWLGQISIYEDHFNRPLLSALVVYLSGPFKGLPANAFFNMATELGRKNSHISNKDFHYFEKNKCYAEWK